MDILYPCHCAGCGELIASKDNFCDTCKAELKFANVKQFRNKLNKFDGLISVFRYEDTAKKMIWSYKFRGKKNLHNVIVEYLTEIFEKNYSAINFDYITYVPMTVSEYMNRGFNQTKLLAKGLSSKTGIKNKKLIRKIRNTKSQMSLDSKEREKNLKNCFKVVKSADLKRKTVLLVDDVKTTGATLNECSKILRRAGVKEIYCITVAIADDSEINITK